MSALTLDLLIDNLIEWRKILPGETPIAHSLDDEGNHAELVGELEPGFLVPNPDDAKLRLGMILDEDWVEGVPNARRVLVLWPEVVL